MAINHDHFFNYRIDLDVDGKNNSFERLKLKSRRRALMTARKRSYWIVAPELVSQRKASARTRINPDRPAALLIRHADKVNKWGNSAGYQIISKAIARPLVDPADPASRRGSLHSPRSVGHGPPPGRAVRQRQTHKPSARRRRPAETTLRTIKASKTPILSRGSPSAFIMSRWPKIGPSCLRRSMVLLSNHGISLIGIPRWMCRAR